MNEMGTVMLRDLRIRLRDRGGLIILLLMPVVMITVMSAALGGLFAGAAATRIALVEQGPLGPALYQVLRRQPGLEVSVVPASRGEAEVQSARIDGLLLPPAPPSAPARWILNPGLPAAVAGRLESLAQESELLLLHPGLSLPPVRRQTPAGMHPPARLTVYQQEVPGFLVLYMFAIMMLLGRSLLMERRTGTFDRLRSLGVSPLSFYLGKVLAALVTNLVQAGIILGMAATVFHLNLGPSPWALLPLLLSFSLFSSCLGLLLSRWAKSDTQLDGIGWILGLAGSALGGCLVPASVMPASVVAIGRLTPQYWAMDGLEAVLVRGQGLDGVLLPSGILLGLSLVALAGTLAAPWDRRLFRSVPGPTDGPRAA